MLYLPTVHIFVAAADSLLNLLDPGLHIFEVVCCHKLCVATGEQNPPRHIPQQVLQQSAHLVNGAVVQLQVGTWGYHNKLNQCLFS